MAEDKDYTIGKRFGHVTAKLGGAYGSTPIRDLYEHSVAFREGYYDGYRAVMVANSPEKTDRLSRTVTKVMACPRDAFQIVTKAGYDPEQFVKLVEERTSARFVYDLGLEDICYA